MICYATPKRTKQVSDILMPVSFFIKFTLKMKIKITAKVDNLNNRCIIMLVFCGGDKVDKKLLFVYNPNSGKGKIKNKLSNIIECFSKNEWKVTVYPTQKSKDATKKISSEASAYDMVVVAGGDGTMNEAVAGLMNIAEEKRPPIGYIPAGTTNDFATSMKIPKIVEKAAILASQGEDETCDVGQFNDGYFVYVAAFGAFTSITYETPQKFKSMFGYAAYLMEGVKTLPFIKPVHMKFTYDDKVLEGKYILGVISNSTSVAGMKISKKLNVSLNDGEFECILMKDTANPIDFQLAFKDLLMQNISSPRLECFKFSKMVVETDDHVKWTCDGEYGGEPKKVEIANLHNAIRVISKLKKDK